MKRMSRVLLGLITCVVPVFIAACYGVMHTFSQRVRVVDKATKSQVAGLRVECVSNNQVVTNLTYSAKNGDFALYATDAAHCATIAVKDDGKAEARYAATAASPKPGKELVIEVAQLP